MVGVGRVRPCSILRSFTEVSNAVRGIYKRASTIYTNYTWYKLYVHSQLMAGNYALRCVVLLLACSAFTIQYNCSIAFYCVVLCCVVLYCVVLCCTVLYCVVLCCIVLYCVVLCCIVLYCGVLCSTVLYCVVLCCIVLYRRGGCGSIP